MKSRLSIILIFAAAMGLMVLVAVGRHLGMDRDLVESGVEPTLVRCATLIKRPYKVNESFYGLIQANARVEMAFQIAGRLEGFGQTLDRTLRENDRVHEGQEIAKLESLRYEAAVQEASAAAEQAKAAMSSAQARIDQAQAHIDDAMKERNRINWLHGRQAANEREVDKADLALKLAQAELDAAMAQRAAAQAAYRSARAAATMAGVNLQDATLRAPMEATVASIPYEVGQMVNAGEPVMSLVDLSRVKLVIGVVERKLPLLHRGQHVSVEIRALASQSKLLSDSLDLRRPQPGRVSVVPPAADRVTGLFNIEIELENKDGLLRPGMIGKATVTVFEKEAIAIPAKAAVRTGDRAWAFFIDMENAGHPDEPKTVARRVTFEPIVFDKDYYLLDAPPQGLTQVVLEGQNRLTDGEPVRVIHPLVQASSLDADRSLTD